MRHIFAAIRRLIETHSDPTVFFPIHKNPKVRQLAQEGLQGLAQVRFMEPLDYEPFANLISRMDVVLTDSGGLQEEAPALGKPVLVLRDNTERPEAVEAGTVALVGTDENLLFNMTHRLLVDASFYQQMAEAVNPYGDGKASARIISGIHHFFDPSIRILNDWQ